MISSNRAKFSKSNREETETEGANSDESFDADKNEKHGLRFWNDWKNRPVLNWFNIAGPGRNKAKFSEFKGSQRSAMPGRGGFRGRKTEQNLRSRKFEGSRGDSLGGKSF